MLSIPVKSITSGEMFTLTAASSTTIGELKAMMEAEHGGGPAAMQIFVLGGERLDNDLTIDAIRRRRADDQMEVRRAEFPGAAQ